jgi:hypothetical protein
MSSNESGEISFEGEKKLSPAEKLTKFIDQRMGGLIDTVDLVYGVFEAARQEVLQSEGDRDEFFLDGDGSKVSLETAYGAAYRYCEAVRNDDPAAEDQYVHELPLQWKDKIMSVAESERGKNSQ